MRTVIVGPLLTGLLLTGCVTTANESPQAEIDAALHKFKQCTIRNAKEIDDGTSYANSIAQAAISLCLQENQIHRNLVVKGKSRYFTSLYDGGHMEPKLQFVTSAILKLRLQQRTDNKVAAKWNKAFALGMLSGKAVSCGISMEETVAPLVKLVDAAYPHVKTNELSKGIYKEIFLAVDIGATRGWRDGNVEPCEKSLADWATAVNTIKN